MLDCLFEMPLLIAHGHDDGHRRAGRDRGLCLPAQPWHLWWLTLWWLALGWLALGWLTLGWLTLG
jgi:hypothetical protein